MTGDPPERPFTALLVAALVLIVGAFVGGTLLTQAISRQMEANASDIASNAAPSVQQLSLERTTLAASSRSTSAPCARASAKRRGSWKKEAFRERRRRPASHLGISSTSTPGRSNGWSGR